MKRVAVLALLVCGALGFVVNSSADNSISIKAEDTGPAWERALLDDRWLCEEGGGKFKLDRTSEMDVFNKLHWSCRYHDGTVVAGTKDIAA